MKKLLPLIILASILFCSCSNNPEKTSIEEWKKEIVKMERDFADMAVKEGIAKAFLTFAADEAVLMRNNSLIIGKESIQKHFENQKSSLKDVKLTWKPDFVDVASSGDLAYTYGKYELTVTDSLDNENVSEGIFHTVWKKQADGSWKFVWD